MIILASKSYDLSSEWQLVGVFILFVFVLGACFLTTKIIGGIKIGQMKNSNFHVIETYRITQNKFLQIVKVGKKYLVLAISKDNVNLITELQDDEMIHLEQMNKSKESFSEIMLKLTNRQNNFFSKKSKQSLEKDLENISELTNDYKETSQDDKNNM